MLSNGGWFGIAVRLSSHQRS